MQAKFLQIFDYVSSMLSLFYHFFTIWIWTRLVKFNIERKFSLQFQVELLHILTLSKCERYWRKNKQKVSFFDRSVGLGVWRRVNNTDGDVVSKLWETFVIFLVRFLFADHLTLGVRNPPRRPRLKASTGHYPFVNPRCWKQQRSQFQSVESVIPKTKLNIVFNWQLHKVTVFCN